MISLSCSLCVDYKPEQIAAAAIRYAAGVTKLEQSPDYSDEWKRKDTPDYQLCYCKCEMSVLLFA